jgi:hypothetical protein
VSFTSYLAGQTVPIPTDCGDCCTVQPGSPQNGGECCTWATDPPSELFLTVVWRDVLCGAWGGTNCSCLINHGSFTLTFTPDHLRPGWGAWVSEPFSGCDPHTRDCGGLGGPGPCCTNGYSCQQWVLGCVRPTGGAGFTFALWLVCLDCTTGANTAYPFVTELGNTNATADPYIWTSGAGGFTCPPLNGDYRTNSFPLSNCNFPGLGPCFGAMFTE